MPQYHKLDTRDQISQSEIKDLVDYDPDSGQMVWRYRRPEMFDTKRACAAWNTKNAGKVAGSINHYGYRQLSIKPKVYLVHRLAALYMTGKFPQDDTDHINGDRADNRWVNLRFVTRSENNKNMKKRERPLPMGVHFVKKTGRYKAVISRTHIGIYGTVEEAKSARIEAERSHCYHKNHGRIS